MARIEDLRLDPITVDLANAIIDVHFRVEYNRSDRDANTPYKLVCKLKGHDRGELGEIAGGDGDDPIPDGFITPAGGLVVRADGVASQEFDFNKRIAKLDLNEDIPGLTDPDEIKVKVTLTPILPEETSAESNIERLVATS